MEAQFLCASGVHQDGSGGAIRGLRGVASRDSALGVEGGLEFGEGFERAIGAGAFVGCEDFFGDHRLACLCSRHCGGDGNRDQLFGESA